VIAASSGELNAYRYENGRMLRAGALSRTTISTSVSSLSDIDAAPVIDQGRVYALGQGGRMVALELSTGQRLWNRISAGISTPWIAANDLPRHRRCASGRTRPVERQGTLDRPAPAFPQREEEDRRDRLVRSGAGGQPSDPDQFGRADRLCQSGRRLGRGDGRHQGALALPPIVANGTLYVLDQKGRVTAYK
jgi:outer membrane protein assembly factor BamB